MGRRRKAREIALQILFQIEFNDHDLDQIFDQYWTSRPAQKDVKEYSRWLVKNVIEQKETLDMAIQAVSRNWRLDRMAVIDRNILRLAVFELRGEENMAPAIIINEAIEIAKKFSGSRAATFINGVLDAVHKKGDKRTRKNPDNANE